MPINCSLRPMSATILLGSLLFPTIIASAQTPDASEGPPGIQIVKYSWSKERIGWERDPVASTEVFGNEVRSRALRERPTASVLADRSEKVHAEAVKAPPPAPPRYAFTYKLSVHNTGPKAIKEIDWDHVFRDSATGQELGRREFTAAEKVFPGRRKELSVFASSPPTRMISIYKLGKNERDGLIEQVIIVRILYDDGSTWQAR